MNGSEEEEQQYVTFEDFSKIHLKMVKLSMQKVFQA